MSFENDALLLLWSLYNRKQGKDFTNCVSYDRLVKYGCYNFDYYFSTKNTVSISINNSLCII